MPIKLRVVNPIFIIIFPVGLMVLSLLITKCVSEAASEEAALRVQKGAIPKRFILVGLGALSKTLPFTLAC